VAAGAAGKIVFNCSNGHRIIVPAQMAGQRGKCSKCGTPVSIPAAGGKADQASSQSGPLDDLFAGLGDDSGSQVSATEFVELPAEVGYVPSGGVAAEQAAEALHSHPTATLVARLFQEREHGGIVEVHIAGGSVILPEFYELRWSVGSHGLFASRAADGTVTLTAVAWDSIQKIVVRQINGLPEGMFE
jgi:hypothetical protein